MSSFYVSRLESANSQGVCLMEVEKDGLHSLYRLWLCDESRRVFVVRGPVVLFTFSLPVVVFAVPASSLDTNV